MLPQMCILLRQNFDSQSLTVVMLYHSLEQCCSRLRLGFPKVDYHLISAPVLENLLSESKLLARGLCVDLAEEELGRTLKLKSRALKAQSNNCQLCLKLS